MPNKTMRRVSQKTIGKKVDTVADYIDILAQMIAEYFNSRYKIEKKVEDIKSATLRGLYSLKREFIKSILEGLFLVTAILALIIGAILYLSRFVSLDIILIIYGLIVTIAVLLKMKVKL